MISEEFVNDWIANTGKLSDLLATETFTAGVLVGAAWLSNISTHHADVDNVVIDVANATAGSRTTLFLWMHYITVLFL